MSENSEKAKVFESIASSWANMFKTLWEPA